MSVDTLSQALSQRRGKGMDPAMVRLGPDNASHDISEESKPQDVRKGFEVPNDGGAGVGAVDPVHGMVDTKVGLGAQETNLPVGTAHTPVMHESGAKPLAASQSMGAGGGELHDDIRGAITGHASQEEYEQLKDINPRSLGERAKMMVLKDQYSNGKKG